MDDLTMNVLLPLATTVIGTLIGAVTGAYIAFRIERDRKRDDDQKSTAMAAVHAIYDWLKVLDRIRWRRAVWDGRISPSVSASRTVSAHLRVLCAQVDTGDERAQRILRSWRLALDSRAKRPTASGIIAALVDFIADKDLEQIERQLAEGDALNRPGRGGR